LRILFAFKGEVPMKEQRRISMQTERPSVRGWAMAVAGVVISFAAIAPAYADWGVEIANGGSFSRVDVMWASTDVFQNAFLWPDNDSLSQEFDLLDRGNGFFQIRARHSGQCLMLDFTGNSGNGNRVIQYPACGENSWDGSEWYAERKWHNYSDYTWGGWYSYDLPYILIRNKLTGRCLDAGNPAGGSPPVESVLQTWDCISSGQEWNAFNQLWNFVAPTSLGGGHWDPPPLR
jgi:hypothetical protein